MHDENNKKFEENWDNYISAERGNSSAGTLREKPATKIG